MGDSRFPRSLWNQYGALAVTGAVSTAAKPAGLRVMKGSVEVRFWSWRCGEQTGKVAGRRWGLSGPQRTGGIWLGGGGVTTF